MNPQLLANRNSQALANDKAELPIVSPFVPKPDVTVRNYTKFRTNITPMSIPLSNQANQIVFNMELDVSNCELDKITRTRKPLMVEQTTCTQILKAPGLKVHKTLVKIEDNLDCDCMNHRYQKRILNRINCC